MRVLIILTLFLAMPAIGFSEETQQLVDGVYQIVPPNGQLEKFSVSTINGRIGKAVDVVGGDLCPRTSRSSIPLCLDQQPRLHLLPLSFDSCQLAQGRGGRCAVGLRIASSCSRSTFLIGQTAPAHG